MQAYEARNPSYFATPAVQTIKALHTSLQQLVAKPLAERKTHEQESPAADQLRKLESSLRAEARQQAAALEVKVKAAERDLDAAHRDLDSVQTQRDQARSRADQLAAELDTARRDHEAALATVKAAMDKEGGSTRAEVTQLQVQVQELKAAVQEREATNRAQAADLAHAQAEAKKLAEQVTDMREDAEDASAAWDDERARLKRQVADLTKDVAALRAEATQNVTEYANVAKDQASQVAKLKTSLDERERQLHDAEDRARDAELAAQDVQRQLDRLRAQLDRANAARNSDRAEAAATLERTSKAADAKVAALQRDVQDARQALDEARQGVARAQADAQQALDALRAQHAQDLAAAKAALQQQIDALKDELEDKERELEDKEHQLDDKERELDELDAARQRAEADREAAMHDLEDVQTRKLREAQTQLVDAMKAHAAELAERASQLRAVQVELAAVQHEYDEAVATSNRDLAAARSDGSALAAQVAAMQKQLDAARSDQAALNDQLAQAAQQRDRERAETDAQVQQLLTDMREDAEDASAAWDDERARLKRQVADLTKDVAALRAEATQNVTEYANVAKDQASQVAKLKTSLDERERQLHDAEDRARDAELAAQDVQRQLDRLRAQLDRANAARNSDRAEAAATLERTSKAADAKVAALQRDVQDARQALDEARQGVARAQADAQQALDALRAQHAQDLAAAKAALQQQIDALKDELEDKERELEDKEHQLDDKERELDELDAARQRAEADREAAMHDLEDVQTRKLREAQTQLVDAMKAHAAELAERASQLRAVQVELAAVQHEYDEAVATSNRDLAAARSDGSALAAQVAAMQKQLDAARSDQAALNDQLAQAAQQRDRERAETDAQVQQLRVQLQTFEGIDPAKYHAMQDKAAAAEEALDQAVHKYAQRESALTAEYDALEAREQRMQLELQGLQTEFDRITRNATDFAYERSKLEKVIAEQRAEQAKLRAQVEDMEVARLGRNKNGENPTIVQLRHEFRALLHDAREDAQARIDREVQEKAALEQQVRNLKREQAMAAYARTTVATQTLALFTEKVTFIGEFGASIEMLRKIFKSAKGQPFIVAGSGTLGWDMVAANLVEPGENALVLNTGLFGDRFGECLQVYGAKVTHLHAPAIGAIPVHDEVVKAVKAQQYKVVTITHVDTSTGVLQDIKALAKLIRDASPSTLVIVDGVCSVGGEDLDMDAWGVDVVLTASQKALGCPPGLCVVVASERAMQTFQTRVAPPTAYYASWAKWTPIMQAYEARNPSYFATPAVQTIKALHTSLQQLVAKPLAERYAQHVRISDHVKQTVLGWGLKLVPTEYAHAAHTLTAVYYPEGSNVMANVKCPACKTERVVNMAEYAAFQLHGKGHVCTTCACNFTAKHVAIDRFLGLVAQTPTALLAGTQMHPKTLPVLNDRANLADIALLFNKESIVFSPIMMATRDKLVLPGNRRRFGMVMNAHKDVMTDPWSMDMIRAMRCQQRFLSMIATWLHQGGVHNIYHMHTKALVQYPRLLAMTIAQLGKMLVPTTTFDIAWHTHQLFRAAYRYGLPATHENPTTIGALFLEVLRQLAQVKSMRLGDWLTRADQTPRLGRNGVRKSMRKDEAVLLNRVDFLNNLLSSKAQQVFSEDYRGELAEAVSSVLQELAAEKITTPFGILLPQNRLFTTSRLGFNLCLHVPNDAAARTFPTSSTTGEWFKATNFHRQLAVYLTLRARDVFSATADEPHALITRSETAWSRVWSTAAELSLPKGDKNRRKTPVDWRSVPHGSLCEEMCCHQSNVMANVKCPACKTERVVNMAEYAAFQLHGKGHVCTTCACNFTAKHVAIDRFLGLVAQTPTALLAGTQMHPKTLPVLNDRANLADIALLFNKEVRAEHVANLPLGRLDFLNNLLSSKAQQVFSEDYRGELAEAVSSVLQELAAEKITTPFGILLPQNRLFTTSRLGFNLCLHVPNDAAARTFPTSSTTGEWFKATNFHRQLAVYLTLRARDVFSATADEPHALITRSETAWSRVWSTAAELSLPKGDKNRRKTPVDWRSVPHGSLCEEMCCHQVGAALPAALDDEFATTVSVRRSLAKRAAASSRQLYGPLLKMDISPITKRYEAARNRKSPTFVPVPRATLSSEWLHELGDLLDLDPIQRDYVECAVD
ncbi:hypothetical protein AMAG_00290 [Allomyces macrogynus ATCC 38327]|uniref:alanine--glyoxylate transaminase n=1 Tax=Allomyces macrogynus (strain ATCC 38327) TaxID=578462 RepID=A0A0L0RW43_ALLM3|nr:hypothetical protein AMAG_00290 [Allomyces macrogynus ATCC 38327]|eukprot:KNE54306.1 hypothetical protein AMAG_00290 [Allomyces macrogynus ATCC 38327]